MSKVFRLDPARFPAFKRTLILRSLPLILLPVIVVFFIGQNKEGIIYLIPIFLGVISYSLWNRIKTQKKAWDSYELTIGENTIERVQAGFPIISISKEDVVEVLKGTNGDMTMITKSKSDYIGISNAVMEREELTELISEFSNFRELQNNYSLIYTYGGGILGLLLFYTLMTSTNHLLSIIIGIIISACIIFAFLEIRKSKNIDKKLKKWSFMFLFLFLTVISKVIYATYYIINY